MTAQTERNEILGERQSIEPFKGTIYFSRKISLHDQTDVYATGIGKIAFLDSGALYALDAVTGALKWSYTTGSAIFSSPAVANGVVYIGSTDDNVYAFHLPGMS